MKRRAWWMTAVLACGCGPTVLGGETFTVGGQTDGDGSSGSTDGESDVSTVTVSTASGSASLTATVTSADSSGGGVDSTDTVDPETVSTTAATTGEPATPMATADCEPLESHVEAMVTQPELHVFGVYETSNDHANPGSATVHVDRPGEVYVVVSSYESTTWTVTAAAGTTIVEVIASGYEQQYVQAPEGTIVLDSSAGNALSPLAYQWSDAGTQSLIAQVEGLTGASLTSFHGCYHASSFVLE